MGGMNSIESFETLSFVDADSFWASDNITSLRINVPFCAGSLVITAPLETRHLWQKDDYQDLG